MTSSLNRFSELSTEGKISIFCVYRRKLNIWMRTEFVRWYHQIFLSLYPFYPCGRIILSTELRSVMWFAFANEMWVWMICVTSEQEMYKPLWDSTLSIFSCAWIITDRGCFLKLGSEIKTNWYKAKFDLQGRLTWVKTKFLVF